MFRGEIWRLDLDPTIGAEMRKTRPVVIVSADEIGVLPLKVVAPLTDWKDKYADVVWMTKIYPNAENKLSKVSAVDAFQVRCVSQQRFIERIGKLSDAEMLSITDALASVLEF
ncbi:MAG: type II toxin-antitoxin system PemK/MazF family toxin [Acidobacteriota bacterium]|nr:type II toxin-antitoxin system PemK/MazF family toxin [Acidobacteriota bacterium]